MNDEQLINKMMINNMLKSFNVLGIEGTLETIECLKLSKLKDKLKKTYYNLLYKKGGVI